MARGAVRGAPGTPAGLPGPAARTSRSTPSWPPGIGRWSPRSPAPRAHRDWQLLEATGWPDNQSCRNLVTWSWTADDGGGRHIAIVNLSPRPAQARIPLDWKDLPGRGWRLTDLLDERIFDRDGDELAHPGLFVALEPWQFHLLEVR